jgi:hypothetical protein
MSFAYSRSWVCVLPIDGRLSVVRVVFSDETESGSAEGIIAVTAVMMNMESQWEPLEKDFASLPRSWSFRREVKGSRLFRDIHKGRGKDSAETLRGICAIPVSRGIPIFSGAVDSKGFKQVKRSVLGDQKHSWSPYDVALLVCFNSVDSYLETVAPWEKVLWISDAAPYRRPMKTAMTIQKVMAESNIMQKLGLDSSKAFKSHLMDPIYFGDSHESRAIQLADVCCSVVSGHLLGDPIAESYYAQIKPRLVSPPAALYKNWVK